MAGLVSKLFSSPIFTWWNSATFGTLLFTHRKGVKVGEDELGNVYYKEKNGRKRWVIYKNGPVEASRVSADWHGWLHYTMKNPPSEAPLVKKEWEKEHQPNKTGSAEAYFPQGALGAVGERAATASDYEPWRP
ncbi:NADH:ubiquinone oxidoreductase subunit NDUFA12 [Kordiimonas aestuarii]|uniref:NADH:ubiquinone oxidoreductase subunit NDUFA12 n=1 Tax=Kordiimonas aestuarii TaxID=1005925 RepID=UPI0021D0E209|nr:NADH:ubiquinone oxidoreductase subunit NDUFA12 [Kordiimonas aestuarii]